MKHPEITSLFKYRRLDTYSIQSLVNEVAWFSTPSSFNDPFDCGVHIDDRKIEEAIEHAVVETRKRTGRDINNIPIEELKVTQSDISAFEQFRSSLYNLFQTAGIFSLSEISDDILMWGHYADSHRGFCVEYERMPENILGRQAEPVEYQTQLPSLTPQNVISESGSIDWLWLTKSNHWNYEKEWRVLSPEGGKLYNIDSRIKSIIFGLNMNQDNREILFKVISGKNIIFKEAIRDKYEFKINVIELKA